VHERNSPIPIEKEGNCHVPTTPPMSIFITYFDWIQLAGYQLPYYVPFHITVHAYNLVVPSRVIYEGTFVSILSSSTWQALGSRFEYVSF